MRALAAAVLLAAPARASIDAGAAASPAVSAASGDAVFTAVANPAQVNGQIALRRLAVDGGVLWELRWGRGRGEEPVALAATADGGAALAGAWPDACFALAADGQGRLLWEALLVRGVCRPSALLPDGKGGLYALVTAAGQDGYDAVVIKLDRRGDASWSYRFPGPVYGQGLTLDPQGAELKAYVLRPRDGGFVQDSFTLDPSGRRTD